MTNEIQASEHPGNVLVVSGVIDELDGIKEILASLNLKCAHFEQKEAALEYLISHRQQVALILYDPQTSIGELDVSLHINLKSPLKLIPMIFLTRSHNRDVLERALRMGALYCLPLPLKPQLSRMIIESAYHDYKRYQTNQAVLSSEPTASFLKQGLFTFRTLSDAAMLSQYLAQACPNSRTAAIGLSEIFINAIEHGNLGIGYEDKSQLHDGGQWLDEVNRRLSQPEHAHKLVELEFEKTQAEIHLTVRDQGAGFDWRKFESMDPSRLLATHGRGIIMARTLAFEHLAYSDKGNEVRCTITLSR